MSVSCYGRLSASEPDSFAGRTVDTRFPLIYSECCGGDYGRLLRETIVSGVFQHTVLTAESQALFEAKLRPYAGLPLGVFFHKAPFLLAEFYFHHLLLELREYGCNRFDFFAAKKELAYCRRIESFRRILHELFLLKRTYGSLSAASGSGSHAAFDAWHLFFTECNAVLLCDESAAALDYLVRRNDRTARIDIVCADSGPELFADIYLACTLLCFGLAERVVFHVKPYPFLERNATVADFYRLAAELTADGNNKTLADFIARKKISVRTADFWILPCTFDEMPFGLCGYFSESALVVIKGDTNYRRLVQDIRWPHTDSFALRSVLHTLPVAASRLVSSEVVTGLSPAVAVSVPDFICGSESYEPSGKNCGVIQCSIPAAIPAAGAGRNQISFRIR